MTRAFWFVAALAASGVLLAAVIEVVRWRRRRDYGQRIPLTNERRAMFIEEQRQRWGSQ